MSRRQQLTVTGIAMVAFYIPLLVLDLDLQATGPSMLAFEFAGSEERAAEIMAEWGESGRDSARLSLWIDFGFMLSYGAFFTLAAIATRELAGRLGRRALGAVGIAAPLFAASAALFDLAENAALLLTLGGHGGNAAPLLATACASLKFLLITLAIAYVLWGLVVRGLERRGGSPG